MITGDDVQSLHRDAKRKQDKWIALLAFEALEHGVGCDAWVRCERIIEDERRSGRVKTIKPLSAKQTTARIKQAQELLAEELAEEAEAKARAEARCAREREYYREYRRRVRAVAQQTRRLSQQPLFIPRAL